MSAAIAATLEVELDPMQLCATAVAEGWGDGLPIVPPTVDLVDEWVAASGRAADDVLGQLPPVRAACTVLGVAVNAVMAGAPKESMPLICTALQAMMEHQFDLDGINATTAATVPAVVVNGPIRNDLDIPYRHSALGGATSRATAIGRAIRLAMRNIGGQAPGVTTESVFGQPGRVAGIVFGEWEERSPWAPLAQRRGVEGNAVTVFGTLGTCNIVDPVGRSAQDILQVIGRSLTYMGTGNMTPSSVYAQQMVAINPIWANDIIARDIPSFDDVRELLWRSATLPVDVFPKEQGEGLDARGRVRDGMVWLMDSPEDLHITVCGGDGNLHAAMLPGFSHTMPVTRAIPN